MTCSAQPARANAQESRSAITEMLNRPAYESPGMPSVVCTSATAVQKPDIPQGTVESQWPLRKLSSHGEQACFVTGVAIFAVSTRLARSSGHGAQ